MSVGVMKDYKLKQGNLRASHTLGSPPSSYQPPDTVDYLRFLYESSSLSREDCFVITSRQRRID
jgi:hypothetical protein